jgi:hypothetical protein
MQVMVEPAGFEPATSQQSRELSPMVKQQNLIVPSHGNTVCSPTELQPPLGLLTSIIHAIEGPLKDPIDFMQLEGP